MAVHDVYVDDCPAASLSGGHLVCQMGKIRGQNRRQYLYHFEASPCPVSVSAVQLNRPGFAAQGGSLSRWLKAAQQHAAASAHGGGSGTREDAQQVQNPGLQCDVEEGEIGQPVHGAGLHNRASIFKVSFKSGGRAAAF